MASEGRRRRVGTRVPAAALGAAAAMLILAPAALATPTVACTHNGAGMALDITVSGTGSPVVRIKRQSQMIGPVIQIFNETSGSTQIICTPNTPDVNGVTSITFDDNSTSPGDTLLTVDQGNGRFEPGSGVETPPNIAEIEWGPVDLDNGNDTLVLLPPTGSNDTIRAGDIDGSPSVAPALNLNNDGDGDLPTINTENWQIFGDTPFTADSNDDVITADGTPGVGQGAYAGPIANNVNFFGGGGNDTLVPGSGPSLLVGEDGNDTLTGGAGVDAIRPGPGNDTIDGAGGAADLVSYFQALSPVTVDLGTTTQQNTVGSGLDTITNTERLQGSYAGDTLIGDSGDNTFLDDGDIPAFHGDDALIGRGGNDTISAHEGNDTVIGGPGNDTMTGGPGTDTLSYAQDSTGPVTVSLGTLLAGQATGGAGSDNLQDPFESLTGSPFAGDVLTGDNFPNFIDARDGNADTVTCLGPGPPPPADSVRADKQGVDSINLDCESVDFTPNPLPPVATTPVTTVKKKKCKKKKKAKHAAAAKVKKCKKRKKK